MDYCFSKPHGVENSVGKSETLHVDYKGVIPLSGESMHKCHVLFESDLETKLGRNI